MIKNAIIYSPDDPVNFANALKSHYMEDEMVFRPCPGDLMDQQIEAFGWVPGINNSTDYIVSFDQLHFIRLKKLERKLPQAAVKRKVEMRIMGMERKPNREEKRQITENVVLEMLPGAPVVESYIPAYFDERAGTFVILTSKESDAELMLDQLRQVAAEMDAPFKLHRWIGENDVGVLTRLVTSEGDILVNDLRDWNVGDNAKLGENGMFIIELGLEIPDTVTFKIDADLKIKSIKFGDVVSDEIMDREEQDQFYEQSTLIIEAATLRTITNGVKKLFDITT